MPVLAYLLRACSDAVQRQRGARIGISARAVSSASANSSGFPAQTPAGHTINHLFSRTAMIGHHHRAAHGLGLGEPRAEGFRVGGG